MSKKLSSPVARMLVSFLLLAALLAPQVSLPALASPPSQAAGPGLPSAPGDHLVFNITLSPDSPNIIRDNQDVTVNFNYISNQAGGVRIFARPYTNGAPTPNYAASGSPLYPTGSGSGNGTFTITTGVVVVDQIHFEILDANQTTLLFEAFIPVYYLFTDAASAVYNISWRLDTPNVLSFDQDVNLSFFYLTRQVGGVRIFARPFTNGQLTPNYAAHGSPIYPTGGGSGTGFFTVLNQQAVVDQVRIQMLDANQTTVLFEAFLPVYFRFRSPTNLVDQLIITPDTPNIFRYGDNVTFNFNYITNQAGGVRIFIRPFSGANLSPAYAASGSPLYPTGSGTGNGDFTLTAGPTLVDHIRIQMFDATQSTLLFEAFLPVSLFWAGSGPPPGPDMHVDAIEVTQAIQDLNNSVDLVASKDTYVRMHVSSPVNEGGVYATLSGKHGFISLAPILSPGNPGSVITVRTAPDRGQINDSFWFKLPSSWTTSGSLTLTARLDPNGAKFDPNPANNTRTVSVNFLETPPLRLRIYDVRYTSGGSTYQAANFHMDMLESWLRRAYPISSLQVTRQSFVYPSSGLPDVDTLHGWLALVKLLNILFSGEDSRIVYYGMVDDGGGFMRGKAASIPGTIAAGPTGTGTWGWDTDGSYGDWYGGHEIGHTQGRYHAEYCGASGGVPYPYPGGRISPALSGNTAIYGFDITTHAIYPPSWEDVMTYCSNEWVSDFTYEGIRSHIVGVGLQAPSPRSVTANDFLVVMGMADLSKNTATLESVSKISQQATLPLPAPGTWTLALLNASNADLATYPFQPQELTDVEGSTGRPAVIAESVPWTDGTVKVEIRVNGQVVASRTASAHAPTVSITFPTAGTQLPNGPFTATWSGADQDGDKLTYDLLYSGDGGQTWQTVATGISAPQLELNTDQLHGGSAMLRVVASDGFLSGQDTSGAFSVPLHAPSVQILSPSENQVFFPTQDVHLQGSAYDLEDGTLGDAAFSWSSDRDGFLGTGASLDTSELSTGKHVITLTATDSNNMSSQAKVDIEIADAGSPVVPNLQSSPASVYVTIPFGGPTLPYTLTLRSSSETELNWTANENIPWLSLDQGSGTTPSDLHLTFDPTGLPVGVHSDLLTLTSAQAGNSPIQVLVSLEVTGNALHLPLIAR